MDNEATGLSLFGLYPASRGRVPRPRSSARRGAGTAGRRAHLPTPHGSRARRGPRSGLSSGHFSSEKLSTKELGTCESGQYASIKKLDLPVRREGPTTALVELHNMGSSSRMSGEI